jgi:hypothetical protein
MDTFINVCHLYVNISNTTGHWSTGQYDDQWSIAQSGFLKSKSGVVVPGRATRISNFTCPPKIPVLVAHHQQIFVFDEQQQQIIWSVFCGFMF